MAENKIFAGPRLRRLRQTLQLTQSAMARQLSISPSYLNLIERNQRPLTVQLLLKLSSTYDIDLGSLHDDQRPISIAELNKIFADPLLAGELPSNSELVDLVDVAPNVALALAKLYGAQQDAQARLSDLAGAPGEAGRLQLPGQEAVEVLADRHADWHEVEDIAERFRGQLKAQPNLLAALELHLRAEWGVSVQYMPSAVIGGLRRRFDRHSNRLFLNDRLSHHERLLDLAQECIRRTARLELETLARSYSVRGKDTWRALYRALIELAALAVLIPKADLLRVGVRVQFALPELAARFDVSLLHVAKRLATVSQGRELTLPPFLFLEFSLNGRPVSKFGQQRFPQGAFSAECARLLGLAQKLPAGELSSHQIASEDERQYVIVLGSISHLSHIQNGGVGRRWFLLGLPQDEAENWASGAAGAAVEVGSRCRFCARRNCAERAEGAMALPLETDDERFGLSVFGD